MTARRHLLLLTAHYPPSSAAGARRPANLAAALRAAGWNVSVVSCGEEEHDWRTDADGVSVCRVGIPEQYRRATRPDPLPAAPGESAPAARVATRPQGRLRRQIVALRCFPDLWRDARRPMEVAAETLIATTPADIIYSTAPPITVHQVARGIARRHRALRWVSEYRDPWLEPGRDEVRWSGTVMGWPARLLLNQLVHAAPLHVAVSHGIARWLGDHGASRVVESLNGIPDHLLDVHAPAVDAGVGRYLGEFYLGRDPRPVAAALGRLRMAGLLRDGFRLELIGDVASALGESTHAVFAREGVDDLIELGGRLPHAEAIERTQRAGLLILLAQGQPDQIPNKLYEYLGARRPILAVVDHQGESRRLLERTGADRFVLTERSTPDDWDAVVARAVEASFVVSPEHASGLDELRSSRQLAEVVRECEGLLD